MNPETPQEPQSPGYTLRTHQPGDIGWIIHRHATLYEKEYGWGTKMEALTGAGSPSATTSSSAV
ncbi:unnamed protein product [Penicillium camemberti]|uniref:Str. FM013 n=1 Tax=Penicillium camemberti (strain FM 013) TaxID=1429867 RepID=A0A0G4PAK4_PENC3|nr:unnamed protein product [Penicillium camemberti]